MIARTVKKKMRETRLRSQILRFFEIAGCAVLLLAGVTLFAAPGFGAVTNRQTFEHSYPLAPGGSFLLENVNGSVQVEGWDRDEVEVEAVKTEVVVATPPARDRPADSPTRPPSTA